MQLRETISHPRRLYSEEENRPAAGYSTAEIPKHIPRAVRPAFPPPFIDYRADQRPAAFPTLTSPVLQTSQSARGEETERDIETENILSGIISSLGDVEHTASGENTDDEDVNYNAPPAVDNTPTVPVAESNENVVAVAGGSTHIGIQETNSALERAAAALRMAAIALQPTSMTLTNSIRSVQTAANNIRSGPSRAAPASAPVPKIVNNSTSSNTAPILKNSTQNASETVSKDFDIPPSSNTASAMKIGAQNTSRTNVNAGVTSSAENTNNPSLPNDSVDAEDSDDDIMLEDQDPAPESSTEDIIRWDEIKLSLRMEILENALLTGLDLVTMFHDLFISEKSFAHTLVCLQARNTQRLKEDMTMRQATQEQKAAMKLPDRLIDVQYQRRYGRAPDTEEEREAFIQHQFQLHETTSINLAVAGKDGSIALKNLDKMFQCTKSQLKATQKFLKDRNYDPNLAGTHWGGMERSALECNARQAGIRLSRKNLPLLKNIARSLSIDDDVFELIDLNDEEDNGSVDDELEDLGSSPNRRSKVVVLRLKLAKSKEVLKGMRDGKVMVKTHYQLPQRYQELLGIVNPPRDLDFRPRELSPPRWHRRRNAGGPRRSTQEHQRTTASLSAGDEGQTGRQRKLKSTLNVPDNRKAAASGDRDQGRESLDNEKDNPSKDSQPESASYCPEHSSQQSGSSYGQRSPRLTGISESAGEDGEQGKAEHRRGGFDSWAARELLTLLLQAQATPPGNPNGTPCTDHGLAKDEAFHSPTNSPSPSLPTTAPAISGSRFKGATHKEASGGGPSTLQASPTAPTPEALTPVSDHPPLVPAAPLQTSNLSIKAAQSHSPSVPAANKAIPPAASEKGKAPANGRTQSRESSASSETPFLTPRTGNTPAPEGQEGSPPSQRSGRGPSTASVPKETTSHARRGRKRKASSQQQRSTGVKKGKKR